MEHRIATGIIRRVDDLGRIVIPKEVRQRLGLKEGAPMEISWDRNGVYFEKYIPGGNLLVRAQELLSDVAADEYLREEVREEVRAGLASLVQILDRERGL